MQTEQQKEAFDKLSRLKVGACKTAGVGGIER